VQNATDHIDAHNLNQTGVTEQKSQDHKWRIDRIEISEMNRISHLELEMTLMTIQECGEMDQIQTQRNVNYNRNSQYRNVYRALQNIGQPRSNANVQCYICGQVGHKSYDIIMVEHRHQC